MSEKIHFEPTWELPNPFYKADGSIMSTKAEWEEKRKAYLELLSEMYYGKMPGRPQTLTASELSNEIICQNTVCHKVVVFARRVKKHLFSLMYTCIVQ